MAQRESPDTAVDIEANDRVLGQQDSNQATSLKLATTRVATESPANAKVSSTTHREERIESPQIKQTPLHDLIEATENDDIGLATLEKNLNDWKNDINTHAPNYFKESGLHMLAGKGFYKMARCLISHGANVRAEDSEKAQPLHLACKGGNVELVNLLLSEGAPIDHLDSDDYLPLHWASRYGCDAVISQLLGPKAKFLNRKESLSGQTPLSMACYHDQRNVVKVLLEYNADLLLTDNNRWTPLFTAVFKCNYDILQTLMDHPQTLNGKILDIPDDEGMTPLMQLCANASEKNGEFQRDKDFIDALLKLNPNVNAQDDEKRTALHFAIESAITAQNTSVSLTIIDHVPNDLLLARDSDGCTAFDVIFDEKGMVKVLCPVLDALIGRLNPPGTDIKDLNKDLLFWSIADAQRHTLAQQILSKLPAAEKVPKYLNSSSWKVMEWVMYYRLQGFLILYIEVRSVVHGPDAYALKSDVKRGKDLLIKLRKPAEKPTSRDIEKGKKDIPATHHTDRKGHEDGNEDFRDMDEILDLFFFKSPAKRVENLNLLEPDENMSGALSEVRAAVFQSYESYNSSDKMCQFRSLKDIVYGPDAIETYTETFERMLSKLYTPKDVSLSATAEAIGAGMTAKAEFTWVHLSSANIDWMEVSNSLHMGKYLSHIRYGKHTDDLCAIEYHEEGFEARESRRRSEPRNHVIFSRQLGPDSRSDIIVSIYASALR
jgi:ankyrin repeat protein